MVTFYGKTEPGGDSFLTLDGHAGGSPAVCAAVSGLMWALTRYLEGDPAAAVRTWSLTGGRAEFRFTGDRRTEGAFALVLAGLELFAAAYPEYIQKKEVHHDGYGT